MIRPVQHSNNYNNNQKLVKLSAKDIQSVINEMKDASLPASMLDGISIKVTEAPNGKRIIITNQITEESFHLLGVPFSFLDKSDVSYPALSIIYQYKVMEGFGTRVYKINSANYKAPLEKMEYFLKIRKDHVGKGSKGDNFIKLLLLQIENLKRINFENVSGIANSVGIEI